MRDMWIFPNNKGFLSRYFIINLFNCSTRFLFNQFHYTSSCFNGWPILIICTVIYMCFIKYLDRKPLLFGKIHISLKMICYRMHWNYFAMYIKLLLIPFPTYWTPIQYCHPKEEVPQLAKIKPTQWSYYYFSS